MARSWLLALVMLTQTSCLLGEAPEYQSRRKTPPVILTDLTEPKLGKVIHARATEDVVFTVRFRSEDAGDPMSFILWRNFDTKRAYLTGNSAPPSSNLYPDEGEATQAALTWTLTDDDVGCNSYTLLLTHASNLNVLDPRDDADVAYVTWWASVVNLSGEPTDVSVDECGGVQ